MGAAHRARVGRRSGSGGAPRPALLEARLRRGRGSGKPSAPFGAGTVVSVTARETDDTTVAPGENVRQTGVDRSPAAPFGWLTEALTVGRLTGDNGHRTRSERVR